MVIKRIIRNGYILKLYKFSVVYSIEKMPTLY